MSDFPYKSPSIVWILRGDKAKIEEMLTLAANKMPVILGYPFCGEFLVTYVKWESEKSNHLAEVTLTQVFPVIEPTGKAK